MRVAAVLFAIGLVGLLSIEQAALVIAVLSMSMSTYAVTVARTSRRQRLAELERQTEAVVALAERRDEVDSKLRDTDGR